MTDAAQAVTLTRAELQAIADAAAEKAASRALERVGLGDTNAQRDINELRLLVDAWRDVRRTFIKIVVGAVMAGLAGYVALQGGWKPPAAGD